MTGGLQERISSGAIVVILTVAKGLGEFGTWRREGKWIEECFESDKILGGRVFMHESRVESQNAKRK